MARPCCTISLPIDQQSYSRIIHDPALFRQWIDQNFTDHPELFPKDFAHGYSLKDQRHSAKIGLRLRRIRLHATGQASSVRPSFLLPYNVGLADEVADALLMQAHGVPGPVQKIVSEVVRWYGP